MKTFIRNLFFLQIFIILFSSSTNAMQNGIDDDDRSSAATSIKRDETTLQRIQRKRRERQEKAARREKYYQLCTPYRTLQGMLRRLGISLRQQPQSNEVIRDHIFFKDLYDNIAIIFPNNFHKDFGDDDTATTCAESIASSKFADGTSLPDANPIRVFIEERRNHVISTQFPECQKLYFTLSGQTPDAGGTSFMSTKSVRPLLTDDQLSPLLARPHDHAALNQLGLLLSLCNYDSTPEPPTACDSSFDSVRVASASSRQVSPGRSPLTKAAIASATQNATFLRLIENREFSFDSNELHLCSESGSPTAEAQQLKRTYDTMETKRKLDLHRFLTRRLKDAPAVPTSIKRWLEDDEYCSATRQDLTASHHTTEISLLDGGPTEPTAHRRKQKEKVVVEVAITHEEDSTRERRGSSHSGSESSDGLPKSRSSSAERRQERSPLLDTGTSSTGPASQARKQQPKAVVTGTLATSEFEDLEAQEGQRERQQPVQLVPVVTDKDEEEKDCCWKCFKGKKGKKKSPGEESLL